MEQQSDGLDLPAKLDRPRGSQIRRRAGVSGLDAANSGYARTGTALIAAIAGLVLLAVALSVGYFNSVWFRERMRQKLVFALQSVTGGAVEIGSFHWRLSRLELAVDDITIHGLEAAGEQPYVHVGHLRARLEVLSIVRREIALRELSLRHPIFHIVVYPDGHTNQPPLPIAGKQNAIRALFDLSMERLEIDDGWLQWNELPIPLNFSADDCSLRMIYARNPDRYDAKVHVGQLKLLTAGQQLPLAQGQAEFSLYTDHLTINSLEVSAGHSLLEASGRLTNWNDPVLTALYKVAVDTSEATAMLASAPASPLRQFHQGELEVTGTGEFSRRSFTTSGKTTFKGVAWTAGPLTIGNLTGGLDFSATPESLTVPHLFASALGGFVTGQTEIKHWLAASPRPPTTHADRANGGAEAQGTANFALRALSVKSISASFPKPAEELLNLNGRVGGTVVIAWRGSPEKTNARLVLDAAPPPLIASGEIPLSGHLEATYSGSKRSFEIATLSAQSKATRLQASGNLGGIDSRLRFTIDTGNLGEIQPILSQLPLLPKTLPLELAGTASISGAASGTLSALQIAGHVELHDFTTAISRGREQPPPVPIAQPKRASRRLAALHLSKVATTVPADKPAALRLHWDEAQADVSYSPQLISVRHAKLRRGPAEIDWEGSASLREGQVVDSSQIQGHLQIHAGELVDLQSIFGTNYPIQGRLDTELQMDGSRQQLNGSGHLALASVVAYGYPMPSAAADLQFQGSSFKLQNLVAANDWGKVTGGGEYDFSSRQFSFLLQGAKLQLERVRQLQARRLHVQGALGFEAQGSGTAEAPVVNAALHLRELAVNGDRLGDFNAIAVTHGADLMLTARSAFHKAALALDGNIRLRGEMPMQAKLVADNLVLDALIKSYFPAEHAAHVVLGGEILVEGAARSPSH